MKNILFASTLLASLSAGFGFAADLPSRKAAVLSPPPPPPIWTGFYAGLNAGYGFGTNNNVQSVALAQNAVFAPSRIVFFDGAPNYTPSLSLPTGAGLAQSGSFSNNQYGFVGGGQIGYNYQWGSNFVVGLEVDIQGSGVRGSSRGAGVGAASVSNPYFTDNTYSSTSVGASSVNAGVDWLGTVRGRLGYLFTPTLLAYAAGGLTYGGVYANVSSWASTNLVSNNPPFLSALAFPATGGGTNYSFVGGGTKSQTLVGWNIGGGLEWMFMPNWSVKAEAIYWNMGSMNVATYSIAPAPVSGSDPLTTFGATRVSYQGVIARAGVNYHFSFGSTPQI